MIRPSYSGAGDGRLCGVRFFYMSKLDPANEMACIDLTWAEHREAVMKR